METQKKRTICRGLLMILLTLAVCLLMEKKADASNFTLSLNNSWVDGNIPSGGVIDKYYFSVPSAGWVTLTYQGWSIHDSYFKVKNSDETTSFHNQECYYSSDTDPITKDATLALEAGQYCVIVNGYGSNYGTYRVRGSFAPAYNTEAEPNNGFETAMPLGRGSKVIGFITEKGLDQLDFYKIQVPAQEKVKITYNSMISDSYVSIWDSNFIMKKEQDVYPASESSPKAYDYEETLAPGTYYIKVKPYSDNTGRYTLTWSGSGAAAETTPAASNQTVRDRKTGYVYKPDTEESAAGGQLNLSFAKPGRNNARQIVIPNSIVVNGTTYNVTSIAPNAFKNNKSVTKVILGANVRSIGAGAFNGCTRLKTVKGTDNLRRIGDKAFYRCKSLKRFTISANVTKIGSKAFSGCKNLKTMMIRAGNFPNASISATAFLGIRKKVTVRVPAAYKSIYTAILKRSGMSKKARIR